MKVGIFDSGMGGLSVLHRALQIMPDIDFIYYADKDHVPYGEKTEEQVKGFVEEIIDFMLRKQVDAIVIACNTATSAAAKHLREKYPDYPIIGLEPALKPAALSMEYPTVLAMATPLTLKEEKFNNLMAQFEDEAEFIKLPAPELVKFIESGDLDSKEEIAYLEEILSPYTDGKVDAVVLGCTHFPFARRTIQRILGEDVLVFDGGLGAARQCRRVLEGKELLSRREEGGTVTFLNSIPEKTEMAKKLFYYKG